MKHTIQIFIFFVFLTISDFAQGWRSRFWKPGSTENAAKAVFEVSNGLYFAGGYFSDTINGGGSYLTAGNLNQTGAPIILKTYGKPGFKYLLNDLVIRSFCKQGNYYYYAGCVKDTGIYQLGVLMKFDQTGDTVWQKIYRQPNMDLIPQMVGPSVDGGFLLAGFFQDWINTSQPGLLIKTDKYGNELWRKFLNKSNPNVSDGKGILQDSVTKQIIIAGYRYNVSGWNSENILILDSLGNNPILRNATTFGATITDIIQLHNRDILYVGRQYYPNTIGGTNLMMPYAACFSLNNPTQTKWKIDQIDRLGLLNCFTSVKQLNANLIAIAGEVDTVHGVIGAPNDIIPNSKARIVLVDSIGNLLSKRYYDYKYNNPNAPNNVGISTIEKCNDGSVIATLRYSNLENNPFFFVKYDVSGCDSVLRYCDSLAKVNVPQYNNNRSFSIFPTPARSYLNVTAGEEGPNDFQFSICDITGKTLVEGFLKAQKTQINIETLANGMYFISIKSGNVLFYNKKILVEEN